MIHKDRHWLLNHKGYHFQMFDLFGENLNLRIKGMEKYRTNYGSCLSILYSALMLWAIIHFGMEFFSTTDPGVQLKHSKTTEFVDVDLVSEDQGMHFFFLPIMIHDSSPIGTLPMVYEEYISHSNFEAIFNMNAYQLTQSSIKTATGDQVETIVEAKDLELKYCSETSWFLDLIGTEVMNVTVEEAVKNYGYCIDASSILISAAHGNVEYNTMRVDLAPCTGTSCNANVNVIVEKLEIKIGFFDHTVDTSNFSEPWNYYYRLEDGVRTSTSSFKKTIMNLADTVVIDDTGVIVERESEESRATVDEKWMLSSTRDTTDPTALYWVFSVISGNKRFEYKRDYPKIWEFLERIGGTKECFEWLIIIVYILYNTYYADKMLICDGVLGDDTQYPKGYKIKDNYLKIKQKTFFSGKNQEKPWADKIETLEACERLINEKLDVRNLVQDLMEFQIIKHSQLRARHHVQIRLLSVSLMKNRMDIEHQNKDHDNKKNKRLHNKVKRFFADNEVVKDKDIAMIKNKHKSDHNNPIKDANSFKSKVDAIEQKNMMKVEHEMSNKFFEAEGSNLGLDEALMNKFIDKLDSEKDETQKNKMPTIKEQEFEHDDEENIQDMIEHQNKENLSKEMVETDDQQTKLGVTDIKEKEDNIFKDDGDDDDIDEHYGGGDDFCVPEYDILMTRQKMLESSKLKDDTKQSNILGKPEKQTNNLNFNRIDSDYNDKKPSNSTPTISRNNPNLEIEEPKKIDFTKNQKQVNFTKDNIYISNSPSNQSSSEKNIEPKMQESDSSNQFTIKMENKLNKIGINDEYIAHTMDIKTAYNQLKMGLHQNDYEKYLDQYFLEFQPIDLEDDCDEVQQPEVSHIQVVDNKIDEIDSSKKSDSVYVDGSYLSSKNSPVGNKNLQFGQFKKSKFSGKKVDSKIDEIYSESRPNRKHSKSSDLTLNYGHSVP